MSSSYSSQLRLELIGTGDQAGTWGTTTNTNLGTLLEQSIAGYATYSCSGGTDTLPFPDGATGTGRNMYIQLNGTGGGIVQVPAYTKLYFVFNNTSSAITFQITGTATGTSIPAAAKVSLVCNGTDVIYATNTFASPTLTGTPVAPTATAGTNTTQIATTAFVQAAALTLATIYPVGSIYTSTVSTNPATTFGFGTWVAFGAGRVLIGTDGSSYLPGTTGGSADAIVPSHTHTASTAITDPGHSHTIGYTGNLNYSGGGGNANTYWGAGSNQATNSATTGITAATTVNTTGTSVTGANLQPYIVVYMWNRIS